MTDYIKEFIYKANQIHDNKYDYSKIEYVNRQTEIIIICKTHGEFEQRPNHLLHCLKRKMREINIKIVKQLLRLPLLFHLQLLFHYHHLYYICFRYCLYDCLHILYQVMYFFLAHLN